MVEKSVKEYKALLGRQDTLEKEYKRLGRCRDLKVNLINDKYQNKINSVLLELEYVKDTIKTVKKFVEKN